jgi:hypothetical protein
MVLRWQGYYARSRITDKFVRGVISHESPANGPGKNATAVPYAR